MSARRRLSQPKRNRWGLAVCILNTHLALLDAQHAPRPIAQLKNVPLQTFDREIFIYRANYETTRLEYHCIVGRVGYGAPGSYRCSPRAPASAQTPVNC